MANITVTGNGGAQYAAEAATDVFIFPTSENPPWFDVTISCITAGTMSVGFDGGATAMVLSPGQSWRSKVKLATIELSAAASTSGFVSWAKQ